MSTFNQKYMPLIARLLLGTVFFVFGLNGFVEFMPLPSMPERALDFMAALAVTGYMLPLIKTVEVVGGLMLLTNRFVPLALALLAPGIINIVLFHLFLAPAGLMMAIPMLALGIYLAYSYRDLYRPMLTDRVVTTASKLPEERFQFDRTAQVRG